MKTAFCVFNSQFAKQMLDQKLGDQLRQKIQDNQTQHNVSYYAEYFSHADYGTTHISVLEKNGDAVAVTTSINLRWVLKLNFSPLTRVLR